MCIVYIYIYIYVYTHVQEYLPNVPSPALPILAQPGLRPMGPVSLSRESTRSHAFVRRFSMLRTAGRICFCVYPVLICMLYASVHSKPLGIACSCIFVCTTQRILMRFAAMQWRSLLISYNHTKQSIEYVLTKPNEHNEWVTSLTSPPYGRRQ